MQYVIYKTHSAEGMYIPPSELPVFMDALNALDNSITYKLKLVLSAATCKLNSFLALCESNYS